MFAFIMIAIIGYFIGYAVLAPDFLVGWNVIYFGGITLAAVCSIAHVTNRLSAMRNYNSILKKGAETLSELSWKVPDYASLQDLLYKIENIDIQAVLKDLREQDNDIQNYRSNYTVARSTFENIVNKVLCYDGYIVIVPNRYDYRDGLINIVKSRGEDADKYLDIAKRIGEQMNVNINYVKDYKQRMAEFSRQRQGGNAARNL